MAEVTFETVLAEDFLKLMKTSRNKKGNSIVGVKRGYREVKTRMFLVLAGAREVALHLDQH